ncbi:hypothetical protein GCM10010303_40760 [Streptomyces purpurascens]|nr:hypothetical protein GCM10010303_40760 [Streptomyces purpurascens]
MRSSRRRRGWPRASPSTGRIRICWPVRSVHAAPGPGRESELEAWIAGAAAETAEPTGLTTALWDVVPDGWPMPAARADADIILDQTRPGSVTARDLGLVGHPSARRHHSARYPPTPGGCGVGAALSIALVQLPYDRAPRAR